jgi:hypothetical protein
MKFSIFENISTTTNIETLPFWVLGNPKTKSMLIASHDLSRIGNS